MKLGSPASQEVVVDCVLGDHPGEPVGLIVEALKTGVKRDLIQFANNLCR